MKSQSEHTGLEKAAECLRWFGVPLVAILGAEAPRLLQAVFNVSAMAHLPHLSAPVLPEFQRLVLGFVFDVAAPALFVLAGARVAPRGRKLTALVLATVWIAYSFLLHVVVPAQRGMPNPNDFLVESVGAVGAAIAVANVKECRTTADNETPENAPAPRQTR